jgi:hypothetical protein
LKFLNNFSQFFLERSFIIPCTLKKLLNVHHQIFFFTLQPINFSSHLLENRRQTFSFLFFCLTCLSKFFPYLRQWWNRLNGLIKHNFWEIYAERIIEIKPTISTWNITHYIITTEVIYDKMNSVNSNKFKLRKHYEHYVAIYSKNIIDQSDTI